MTGFFNALSASLVLLMLMSVGYFMGVLGWMTAQEKKFVSKYIVNIAVPCNCVVGLMNNLSHDQLAQAGVMLVSALLVSLLDRFIAPGSKIIATLLKVVVDTCLFFISFTIQREWVFKDHR